MLQETTITTLKFKSSEKLGTENTNWVLGSSGKDLTTFLAAG
jgi:hypothetical protein